MDTAHTPHGAENTHRHTCVHADAGARRKKACYIRPKRPNMIPRRLARISPTNVDDFNDAAAMEIGGDRGQGQQQQQEEDSEIRVSVAAADERKQEASEVRVSVAAADAHMQEEESRRSATHAHRLLVKTVGVMLLGLIAGSACLVVYVWVDSFLTVSRPQNLHATRF